MLDAPESKRTPGCGYMLSQPLIPVVSLILGWAGIDRAFIGDYKTMLVKWFILIGSVWSMNRFGDHHLYTFLFFWALFYAWISDIIWTRRNYRDLYGIPTLPPTGLKAFMLALVFGLSGIDRFYINDRTLGAVKLAFFVASIMKPDIMPHYLSPTVEACILCWYACDIVLSPVRAGLQ